MRSASLILLPLVAWSAEKLCEEGACDVEHDVTLLQTAFRFPPAYTGENHSDIPEASFAWAIFQEVTTDNPADLKNDTELESPRSDHNQAAELREKIQDDKVNMYLAAHNPNERTPEWFFTCMGNDYHVNNYSSHKVNLTVVPQLVPFVVPQGTPGRSDVSVVIAPGGGGEFLAWEAEGTDVAKWFNILGISAFVLKYRVPAPETWERSASVLDMQRALSLVRKMAPALGLNKSRVGVCGASHGAYTATFAAFAYGRQYARRDPVDDESAAADFMILNYPELPASVWQVRAASNESFLEMDHIKLGDINRPPPIWIGVGSNDKCADPVNIYSFHMALRRKGDPTIEINVFDGIGHGFSMCYRLKEGGYQGVQHEACTWMLRARRFIKWNIEGETPDRVQLWYDQVKRFDTPTLLTVNVSGSAGA